MPTLSEIRAQIDALQKQEKAIVTQQGTEEAGRAAAHDVHGRGVADIMRPEGGRPLHRGVLFQGHTKTDARRPAPRIDGPAEHPVREVGVGRLASGLQRRGPHEHRVGGLAGRKHQLHRPWIARHPSKVKVST